MERMAIDDESSSSSSSPPISISTESQEQDGIHRSSSTVASNHPSSLSLLLRILYALNGATLQLPSLALLSIVNDRVAIPPEYLPVYGAVSFLPWSMKPLYAFCSKHLLAIASPSSTTTFSKSRLHLMAILFLFSGLSYLWTAFLPARAVVQAFFVAFVRGITSSWPEFLMDLTLMESARGGCGGGSSSTRSDITHMTPTQQQSQYEPTVSLFQSQAATCRNAGSLVASILTFGLFGARQFSLRDIETQLSVAVVTALLFAAAGLQFVASGISLYNGSILLQRSTARTAYHQQHVPLADIYDGANGRGDDDDDDDDEAIVVMHDAVAHPSLDHDDNRQPDRKVHFKSRRRQPYESIAAHEDEQDVFVVDDDEPLGGNAMSPLSLEKEKEEEEQQQHQQQQGSLQQIQSTALPSSTSSSQASSSTTTLYKQWIQFQQRCDVATLASFQLLLILAALQHPIESVISTQGWLSLLLTTIFCLLGAIVLSFFFQRKLRYCHYPPRQETPAMIRIHNDVNGTDEHVPPRRLGMYLILHHSVPISAFLMYSYLYTIFAAEPLFLQILSMAGTAASTAATWVYGRYLATRYSTGWSMIRLIAVLSIVVAVISLLDVLVVHAAQTDLAGDVSLSSSGKFSIRLYFLVFLVRVITSFSGEIGFMPSVVLATANVVKSDPSELESSNERGLVEEKEDEEGDHGREDNDYMAALASTPTLEETRILYHDEQKMMTPVYDESMQYASFVSCIDFGAQVGDWISVPIIAALGVSRDNGWENLDWFIAICAIGRIASVSFLPLIRPGR